MLKQFVKKEIIKILKHWLKVKGIKALPPFSLEEPPKSINADLASNLAMLLAKELRINPRNIAQEISDTLNKSESQCINNVEVAGAGFINISLKNEFFHRVLHKIVKQKDKLSR